MCFDWLIEGLIKTSFWLIRRRGICWFSGTETCMSLMHLMKTVCDVHILPYFLPVTCVASQTKFVLNFKSYLSVLLLSMFHSHWITSRSVSRSVHWSIHRSVLPSDSQSASQLVHPSVHQSVNHLINKSGSTDFNIHQSSLCSAYTWCICWTIVLMCNCT